jgi:hypothetical protein
MNKFSTAILALILSGYVISCAPMAAEIEPAQISSVRYDDWSCAKIAKERAFVDEALPKISAQQDEASEKDALMVFLIGVPTSGGGIKSEVARLKGEQEALRRAHRDKEC